MRELPDFLKRGDRELGLPRDARGRPLKPPRPAAPPLQPNPAHTEPVECVHDPANAPLYAAQAWAVHVAAGRIQSSRNR